MWKCAALAALLLQTPAAPPVDYRAVVEAFASTPDAAIAGMLAMPADVVARGAHEAAQADSGWPAEALDRALLMHGDAAIALSLTHSPDADRQIALADEIASAAARRHGNEWFAHRWYRAFTARVTSPAVADHWRAQPWYHASAAVDLGRELERSAATAAARLDTTVYDPSEYVQAASLFETGVAAHLTVAAVHLGRIQMLRGKDGEAKRLFETAARDPDSRVNRYLAELFLGSMLERDQIFTAAETHYKAALAALPRAQSGRVALAAVLARAGRDADARRAIADTGTSTFYDPWWSYFSGTARDHAFIFAELHSEVCR